MALRHRGGLSRSALGWLIAAAAVLPAGASAAAAPAASAAPVSLANSTSRNFAAWEFVPGTAATSVTAEFRQPSVRCTSATSAAGLAVWMYTGSPQKELFNVAGVIEQCYAGHATASPDVDVNGGTQEVDRSLAVHGGDVVRLTIATSALKTSATVRDLTKGHTFTLTMSRTGTGAGLVELIGADSVLNATKTARLPIPDFGTVRFVGAAVSGRAIGDIPPASRKAVNLVSSTGVLEIVTGSIGSTEDNAFDGTWIHA